MPKGRAALAAVILSAALCGPVSRADAWHGVMPRWWYQTLAQCETGNNPKHATRSYVTEFGIYRRTWNRWADTPHQRATRLSFAKKVTVVDRIAWRGHTEAGDFTWPVGPWGWGCVKRGPQSLRDAICSAKHKAVQRWKRNCQKG